MERVDGPKNVNKGHKMLLTLAETS